MAHISGGKHGHVPTPGPARPALPLAWLIAGMVALATLIAGAALLWPRLGARGKNTTPANLPEASSANVPVAAPSPSAPASSVPGPGRPADQVASAPGNPPPTSADLVQEINRANQLLEKGQPAQAVEVLTRVKDWSPDDEDVRYNLGIALARMFKNDEAVQEYKEALRLFPEYAEAHNNLGNLLLRMGRREEALQHFEQAVQITPDYAPAWNNLGTALQQLGRTNEAGEHFLKAVGLDTNYWQARFNLATSYLQRSRLSEARQQFEAVLRLQPDFTPAKAALERLRPTP